MKMSFLTHLFKSCLIATVIGIGVHTAVFPQMPNDCPEARAKNKKSHEFARASFPARHAFRETESLAPVPGDVEKSIKTGEKVYLSFCVSGASVKVNGWNRREIRAFVRGRSDIGFKVRQRSETDRLPQWIELFAGEVDESSRTLDSCLSGESIELDVPFQTSVTISGKSGETSVSVDSVKTVKIDISSGDISLSNISRGIVAKTGVGGVSVRKSIGKMEMTTTAGNILAYETESDEIGDFFKAKTISGSITLQSVKQKEVEASSLTGSINYLGPTYSSGNYSFSTTQGLISMAVPADSAFKLKAAYGGSFSSELPLQNIYKKAASSTVFLTGFIGNETGASISLNSYSGTIRIVSLTPPKTP